MVVGRESLICKSSLQTQENLWFLWSHAGAAAGAVTGVLTTPFDVLKTRLMTQGSSGTYKHVGDCAAKIWREEGWRTFFKVGRRTTPAVH